MANGNGNILVSPPPGNGNMFDLSWQTWLQALYNTLGSAWIPFSPTVGATSGTITSSAQSGRYKLIGKTAFVHVVIQIVTNGTGAGGVTVTLPFSAYDSAIFVGRANTVTGKALQGLVSGSSMTIWNYDNSYPGANSVQLILSGCYETI